MLTHHVRVFGIHVEKVGLVGDLIVNFEIHAHEAT